MTISLLRLPDEGFQAKFRREDLRDFGKRDQRLLEAVSIIDAKVEWLVKAALQANKEARLLEANQIRLRQNLGNGLAKQIGEQRQQSLQLAVLKWVGIALAAGTISTLLAKLLAKLWP